MSRKNQITMLDEAGLLAVPVSAQRGREFETQAGPIVDMCSPNYLGLDYEGEIIERGLAYAKRWGTLSGCSRLEVDPALYRDLEKRIAAFTGAPSAMLSHTITITNFSIIPAIVEKGLILADAKVHTVVYEACRLARDHGARLERFRHQDLNDLEAKLKAAKDVRPKLIAIDGVYSISTEVADIKAMQDLCRRYDAWLYVDDAHGFGILGHAPTDANPYGVGGGGVVRRAGADYSRTFYVTSFNKAFCTHSAFSTTPPEWTRNLAPLSTQYLFSAPPSPFLIGTVQAALDLNEREGEARRAHLRSLTARFLKGLSDLDLRAQNNLLQPVVYVEIGTFDDLVEAARTFVRGGCIAGMRAYPLVPEDQCGLRFALSSLHTEAHVDRALTILDGLRGANRGKRAAGGRAS